MHKLPRPFAGEGRGEGDHLTAQTRLWQFIVTALAQSRPVILLMVLDSRGSTPGKTGVKMAVTQDGGRVGTIGGGAIEHSLLKQAFALLADPDFKARLSLHRHDVSAKQHASGMICGGEQTVLLYRCRAEELAVYEQLAAGRQGLLSLSALGMQFIPQNGTPCFTRFSGVQEGWLYEESSGVYKQAYLIGGGHVSLALSRILVTLDFVVTVIDARDNLDSFVHNQEADHKLIMPYSELAQFVPEGDQVFVFIMTHSHKTDQKAAAALLSKRLFYLGLLGSRKKIAQITAELTEAIAHSPIRYLRAPMGLPINSHTPAEIAVSIAAELIQLLNAT